MSIRLCPHCKKPIDVNVDLRAVAEHQDEVDSLLTDWLGVSHFGGFQIDMMRDRVMRYGMPLVKEGVGVCIKAGVRNWNYLDKVLDGGGAVKSYGSAGGDLVSEFFGQEPELETPPMSEATSKPMHIDPLFGEVPF